MGSAIVKNLFLFVLLTIGFVQAQSSRTIEYRWEGTPKCNKRWAGADKPPVDMDSLQAILKRNPPLEGFRFELASRYINGVLDTATPDLSKLRQDSAMAMSGLDLTEKFEPRGIKIVGNKCLCKATVDTLVIRQGGKTEVYVENCGQIYSRIKGRYYQAPNRFSIEGRLASLYWAEVKSCIGCAQETCSDGQSWDNLNGDKATVRMWSEWSSGQWQTYPYSSRLPRTFCSIADSVLAGETKLDARVVGKVDRSGGQLKITAVEGVEPAEATEILERVNRSILANTMDIVTKDSVLCRFRGKGN
jgi:hypothetical protein